MSRVIKKISKQLAFIMVALMCLTILPISAKADQVPESITITRTDLNTAKSNYDAAGGYGLYADKGIKYWKISETSDDGYFELYEPTEYILGENITLTNEALVFSNIDVEDILSASFNLNGHVLTYSTQVIDEDIGPLGAVNVYARELTIKGEGEIRCSSESQYCVVNMGKLIINGGKFYGEIDTFSMVENPDYESILGMIPETIINDGCFNDKVYLSTNSYINGGKFMSMVYSSYYISITNGEFNNNLNLKGIADINGGTFNKNLLSLDGYVVINGGEFYGVNYFGAENNHNAITVINGGKFVYNNNPYYANIEAENVMMVISDAYVENKSDSKGMYDYPAAVTALKTDDSFSSGLYITGGTFIGGAYDYALHVDGYDVVDISGGTFSGYLGAVGINSDELPNVVLSGGKFSTYGPEDPVVDGAITVIFPEKKYAENIPEYYFDYMLDEGYQFKPLAKVVNKGIDETYGGFILTTQRELEVVPATRVINDEGNDSLVAGVNAIVDQIKKGEIPEGVSAELAQAILEAVESQKDIEVAMTVNVLNPEDIKDDVKEISGLITNSEKLLGYYDIKVAVSIDGEVKGFITKFADGVLISLPQPEGLPAVAAGYERVFSLIRVHDGVATKIPAELADGFINAYSDSYSTYALVYEDVKATPQTGDVGPTGWIILATAFGAAGIALGIYKKEKSKA